MRSYYVQQYIVPCLDLPPAYLNHKIYLLGNLVIEYRIVYGKRVLYD